MVVSITCGLLSQWVRVAIWYISGPSSGSYIPTLGSLYVLYRHWDPLGKESPSSPFKGRLRAPSKEFGFDTRQVSS